MKKPIIYFSIIFIALCFYFLVKDEFLTFSYLQSHLQSLISFKQEKPFIFWLGFEISFLFLTSFSIPGSILLTLLAGVVYGKFWGSLLVTLNGALGATLAFLMARYFLKNTIEQKIAYKSEKINQQFKKNGLWYLWMLRMMPGSPYVIINLVMGLTNLKTWNFFLVTALGMYPGNFIFTYAGDRMLKVESIWDILSPQLFFLLIVLGVLPVLLRQIRII
jgi:uncharacterized membrane protein YdjX (TVP38/TMEM64 family)